MDELLIGLMSVPIVATRRHKALVAMFLHHLLDLGAATHSGVFNEDQEWAPPGEVEPRENFFFVPFDVDGGDVGFSSRSKSR